MDNQTKFRKIMFASLILVFVLAACAPAAATEAVEPESGETGGEVATSAPEGGAEATKVDESGYPVPQDGEAMGTIVIDAASACDVATQEQVAAAFGKEVVETDTDDQAMGTGCEFKFDSEGDTQVQVTIYEGDAAKHYFAGLNDALAASCDAFFEKLFDFDFLLAPDSGQDVSTLSLGDLYTTYVGNLGNCMFVQNQARPDAGDNVVSAETIYLNWSSNVAVISNDRVVEFIYQEPIPADAQAVFQGATDQASFYAAAQPYRDSVLVGYTDMLIALLHAVTM